MPSTFTRHWAQRLRDSSQPAYLLIPELLAEDLASGRLTPGDRLPPLRELAQALQVTPGTINRAYAEAQRRGLLQGEVGRGTYVRSTPAEPVPTPMAAPAAAPTQTAGQVLDLSIIKPSGDTAATWLRGALVELANGTVRVNATLDGEAVQQLPLHEWEPTSIRPAAPPRDSAGARR